MTRPEWIFFDMAVLLGLVLSTIVFFATAGILAVNVIKLQATPTTEEKRRSIVTPCLIIIGSAAALWAILMTIHTWWFIVSNARFECMLLHLCY